MEEDERGMGMHKYTKTRMCSRIKLQLTQEFTVELLVFHDLAAEQFNHVPIGSADIMTCLVIRGEHKMVAKHTTERVKKRERQLQ